MRPESVISSGNPKCGHKVVQDAPDQSWAAQRRGFREVKAIDGDKDDESGVQPVNLFVPVAKCEWVVLNVGIFGSGKTRPDSSGSSDHGW